MPRAMSAQGTLRYYKPQFPRAFSNRYAAGDFNDFSDFKVKMYQPQRLLASQVKQQHAQLMEVAKSHCEQWGKMVARLECSSSPNAHMIVTSTNVSEGDIEAEPEPKVSEGDIEPEPKVSEGDIEAEPEPKVSEGDKEAEPEPKVVQCDNEAEPRVFQAFLSKE